MAMAKRIFLFMITNILIMVTITTILSLLGVSGYHDYNSPATYNIDVRALAVFCLVWGFGGAFISLLLSKVMAKWMMGVQIIRPESANSVEQNLLQTVYRLATTAGLKKMPEVGIYRSPEVNAFATGPTKNNALVAVSSGLLQRMGKEEVEGVLAHEVAHIVNGDMVTMTLLQGVVNAFVMFFARILATVVSSAISKNDDEGPSMINFLLVIAFEIAFGILGMMVVGYFSRMREFRADQGGARLAGRPKMIAALQALQGTTERVDTQHAALASLKISGKRGGFAALFSTHPPLELRIRRLQTIS